MKGPLLIIGIGLAGTGKSIILKEVASKFVNLFYIDKDDIHNSFILDKNLEKRENKEFYDKFIRLQGYKAMFEIAKQHLIIGKNVILDGYLIDKLNTSWFEQLLKNLEDTPHQKKFIYFYCDKDLIFDRLKKRNYWRDKNKLKDKNSFFKYYEKDSKHVQDFNFDLKLDTSKNINDVTNEFIKVVEKWMNY